MPTAAEIAREIGNDNDLKRKSKVVSFNDLPGVPEGTRGIIALVNGWGPWVRSRVLFDNGVDLGSINREDLVAAKRYADFDKKRLSAIESGVFDRVEADDEAGEGDGEATAEGEGITVGGVTVPQHLLDRSAAARERLGVPAA